jgi:hypothetical protein
MTGTAYNPNELNDKPNSLIDRWATDTLEQEQQDYADSSELFEEDYEDFDDTYNFQTFFDIDAFYSFGDFAECCY